MTLSEFGARYRLTPESVEALFRKINVSPNTPIDEELEGILLNLSNTRVPVYPAKRRSALSPAELEILLNHYELYIEPAVFFAEGFYAFGKMLSGLLQKTEKTIAIPADMVVTLKKRMAAEPNNQSLGALKTVLVQLARTKRGIASPIITTSDTSFVETVFRTCPGENLAILAQNPALSQSLIQEAGRNNPYLAFFYLDPRGFMRVNQEIVLPPPAPAAKPPALYVQTPAPAPTDAPTAPLSPTMTGAGTVQQESVSAPLHEPSMTFAPPATLLHKTPQPLTPPAEAVTIQRPSAAYPAATPGETEQPSPVQRYQPNQNTANVYPAYPVQDVSQLTPGAVPHPFPGPETRPPKVPMHMEPFPAKPSSFPPAPPFSPFTRQNTSPSLTPLPKQEIPPIVEPVAIENAFPVPPADDMPQPTPPAPEAPQNIIDTASTPAPAIPAGMTRDTQGRLVKRSRLHKAPPGVSLQDSLATPRQPTMKERFVQGLEEDMSPDEHDPHGPEQKLSNTLKALYAVLAVLGLGIIGILIYYFLF